MLATEGVVYIVAVGESHTELISLDASTGNTHWRVVLDATPSGKPSIVASKLHNLVIVNNFVRYML
jgi:hypothetical protein